MPTEIICVTGNAYKFDVINRALKPLGVELVQQKLDLDEIQTNSVQEVAKDTARRAAEKLGKGVITTDAGCAIEALGGFPGPFLKFINTWLSAEDYLRLMNGKEDRRVKFIEAIGCCTPGKAPVAFVREFSGKLASQMASRRSTKFSYRRGMIG